MNSYYDYPAKAILHSTPPPPGITVDVVEKDDEPGLVYLRLYAIEIHDKPDSATDKLRDWLQGILDELNRSLSVGRFTYEISVELPR